MALREEPGGNPPRNTSPTRERSAPMGSDPASGALSALEQLVLSAIAEPPLPPPPRPITGRRSLAQTSDGVPLPPVKRSRAGQESLHDGQSLSLLAAEALRQMAPVPLARPYGQPFASRPLAATSVALATAQIPLPSRRLISRSESSGTTSSESLTSYTLSISQQPPARAVYKRIIRPFPSVSLVWGGDAHSRPRGLSNLFVEVFLVDDGRADAVLPYLEGTRIARVTDRSNAVFTKLKIQCTSQMLKTAGRESVTGRVSLCFTLKEFTGNAFQTISSVRVVSTSMEIFSHTQYLTDSSDGTATEGDTRRAGLPTCTEILPASGRIAGGTRCVILGEGFENSPKLSVQFGNSEVPATYHEGGTILVTAPQKPVRGMVPFCCYSSPILMVIKVRVSNDGVRWSTSNPPIFFAFI